MKTRCVWWLGIVMILLAACMPAGGLTLPTGLTLEEYPLKQAPTLDPLEFMPVSGSMESLYARHAAERTKRFLDNSFFLDGHFSLRANLGTDSLRATENYESTGKAGWVSLTRNELEIYRIETGMASPITSLRALWTYDDHWVLETAYIDLEQVVGRLTRDGQLLNERFGYEEAFEFQLMQGRPFFFFRKGGQIGFSYDGHEVAAGYDEIPHYTCCSASELNPRKAENMTAFFARRGSTWYYVEIGYF